MLLHILNMLSPRVDLLHRWLHLKFKPKFVHKSNSSALSLWHIQCLLSLHFKHTASVKNRNIACSVVQRLSVRCSYSTFKRSELIRILAQARGSDDVDHSSKDSHLHGLNDECNRRHQINNRRDVLAQANDQKYISCKKSTIAHISLRTLLSKQFKKSPPPQKKDMMLSHFLKKRLTSAFFFSCSFLLMTCSTSILPEIEWDTHMFKNKNKQTQNICVIFLY